MYANMRDRATIARAMASKPRNAARLSPTPRAKAVPRRTSRHELERQRAKEVARPSILPSTPPPPSAPQSPPRPPSYAPPPTSANFEVELHGKLKAFAERWAGFKGTEQSGAQPFLQELLEIYEVSFKPGTLFEQHPIRVHVPPSQTTLFAMEEPAQKKPMFTTERMDMYLPKVCVWEMKGPSEDLEKHHDQILGYWAKTRTRYMVLCNFREFWIYDTDDESGDGQLAPKVKIPLDELAARGDALLFLRGERPDLETRSVRVTAGIAKNLGRLVRELIATSKKPDLDRERVAKFVLECVFAMFAEDTDLVPPKLFANAMKSAVDTGKMNDVWSLFDDFATRDSIQRVHRFAPYVNGPLFDRSNPKLSLSTDQIQRLHAAAHNFDWQGVRPEIFGAIFEQSLDVVERHELGAHFTREEDIERVIGPTIIEPWQQRISAIRTPKDAERVVEQMKTFHVLDPACGCGNFLYVVYREMKRLESALVSKWIVVHKATAKRKADVRPPPSLPYFSLEQVHGIELNGFAAFLARVVMWIGEHLAARELGLDDDTLPLKSLDKLIVHGDALLTTWPRPDGHLAIVGNPPYLGVRKMRDELGDEYVDDLFAKYPHNRAADYVTYWFAQAISTLRKDERAGFVCTNSVAQNESREASIDRVLAAGGTLTDVWKSYPWSGESAVHVSIVNWIMGSYEGVKTLDGHETDTISPNLSNVVDVSRSPRIHANDHICFFGVTVGNPGFVLSEEERAKILEEDPSSKRVIKPYIVGRDINRELDHGATRWIIDFGLMEKSEAESFPGAFRHVKRLVYPERRDNRREARAKNWWRFVEPATNLRRALSSTDEVFALSRVSPHLILSRQPSKQCFDGALMVIALSSSYHFGILQSALHSAWAWARGSSLKGDLRYTNRTVFETYPFPLLPDGSYDPRVVPYTDAARALAAAADEFERVRAKVCQERGVGLTKVHNMLRDRRQPDLCTAYEAMNDAVDACYGFPAGTWRSESMLLRRLLGLSTHILEPVNAVRSPANEN